MIIAFDGNVFVGKTSLIKSLFQKGGFVIISEHNNFLEESELGDKVLTTETAKAMQLNYLNAERKRYHFLLKNKINLIDRSFVSMAAHIFALNDVYGVDIIDWFLREIKQQMDLGCIIIPDIFCYVRCTHKTIEKRVSVKRVQETDPMYYSKKYLRAIDNFNINWSNRVKSITIDTEGVQPIVLTETLIQQISTRRQGVLSMENIYNFLRDTLKHKNSTYKGGQSELFKIPSSNRDTNSFIL